MDNVRELEISNEALEYSKREFTINKDWTVYDVITAFGEGAKWADGHPKDGLVDIIDVCDWWRHTFLYLDAETLRRFVDEVKDILENKKNGKR